mgnify:CR=1 FL=1
MARKYRGSPGEEGIMFIFVAFCRKHFFLPLLLAFALLSHFHTRQLIVPSTVVAGKEERREKKILLQVVVADAGKEEEMGRASELFLCSFHSKKEKMQNKQ